MTAFRRRRLEATMRERGVAWALAAAVLVLGGCYKPNITDNGFQCAPTGKACPDGFQCGVDGRCSLHPVTVLPPVDAGVEAPTPTDAKGDVITDAGDAGADDAPMCSAPAMMCQVAPAADEACSPACQIGCGCGRCNVVDGKPACVATGPVKLGDVCTPGVADNCAAGLICLVEACGNGLARCYRHCETNDQCDGTACTIAIDDGTGAPSAYTTCDVPPRTCDPVAGTGCPDPALNCYLTSANQTLCDCPTRPAAQGMNNADCTIYSDCAEGFICISGVDGQTTPHCHFVCDVSKPSCPTSTHCVPAGTGGKFGYCAM